MLGDNADLRQEPAHQSSERKAQDHHWFHIIAVKDRVTEGNISDCNPKAQIETVPLHTFLPSEQDYVHLNNEFIVLIARIFVTYLPAFKPLQSAVPVHIPHKYSKEMEKK